jgi:hypothetical protein
MIWNDTKRDAAASFIRRRDLIAFGRPTTTVGCRGRSPASASAHAMLTDSRIIVLPKANLKDLLNKNADLFSFDLTTIAHRKPVPPPVDCTLLTEERAAASNSSGLLPQRTHCYVRRPVDLLARRRA